jgi:aminopeptidase YwaD
MAKLMTTVETTGKASVAAFDGYAEVKARSIGLTGMNIKPVQLEITAKTIIPKITSLVTEKSYRGYADAITKLDPKIIEKYPYNKGKVDTQEISRLCNGKNSALDIKKLIDTQSQHEVTDLQDIINYIYILKEAGLVTI